MKAKVTELSNKLYWIQDDSTTLEQVEAFNNCTTTLSELKEMWEDKKIWKEVKQGKIQHDTGQYLAYLTLKNSPRKFTIEQIIDIASQCYINEEQVLTHLTKLPPQGLEVEIENNKIVKVYV